MDCVSVIIASLFSSFQGVVDAALGFLRNWGAEGAGNLFHLQQNADTLAEEMTELKEIRDDLENRVRNLERQPRMRSTHRVSGWLENVDALHLEVRSLQDSLAAGRPTFPESCSPDSLRSGWVLGGQVACLLKRVRELVGKVADLNGQLVDEDARPDPVVAVPSKTAWVVGGEETLSTIRSYLKNEKVGIIGIYGVGGVGKTTLLAEIHHQLLAVPKNDFDVVIWVTVSREANVYKIQEDIGVRLGYARRGEQGGHPLPENEEDRRETLYRALYQKKFLLLLDDLWEKLDLEKIGVPHLVNREGKKIVFTTRSLEVCADMDVQAKVKVGFLSEQNSWKLFCSKVDAQTDLDNNPDIRELAKTVVGKCGGLPLALITMGRAMSHATRVGEWRQAVNKLIWFPDEIRGMKDVLSILKFSFDNLEDDTTRECLLYCALYPEDWDIWIPGLVDFWVGEGFLDTDSSSDSGGIVEARDRGDCIIRKLKDACLLESGNEDEDMCVKMHDVVREMALWLTGEEFDRKNRFMVCDGERGMARLADATMWRDARRISIPGHYAHVRLPSLEIRCGNLLTVLITSWGKPSPAKKLVITQNFWGSLPAVRVLDLSATHLMELPGAIGSLVELRYLNLSGTEIRQLPKEVGKLVKLRQLILKYTLSLSLIPREAICTLAGLHKLDLLGSAYRWGGDDDDDSGGAKLSEVGNHLGRLEELSVTIHTVSSLQVLAQSEKLRKCATGIALHGLANCTSRCLSAALNKLERLRVLHIRDWGSGLELTFQVGRPLPPPLFLSCLLKLSISKCHRVKDLRWVGQLPQLKELFVSLCKSLEELLVDDGLSGAEAAGHGGVDDIHPSAFCRLVRVNLWRLPALRSISRRPLLFPSLELLRVGHCPMLRRLPLGPHSCPKIRRISSAREWWDALEWDDYDAHSQRSSIKSALAPFLEYI